MILEFPHATQRPHSRPRRRHFVPIERETNRAIDARARELSRAAYEAFKRKLAELVMRGLLEPEDVITWTPEDDQHGE